MVEEQHGKDLTKIENMMYTELVSLKKRVVGDNQIRQILWGEALMRFMKDGSLSDENYEQIMREAQELHISQEEVLVLIERVKQDRAEMGQHQLPIAAIREKPEIAFEQFRITISNLRQIATEGDRKQMQELFDTPGRATDDERAIWRQIDRR